ncbi:MAG: hypothetical protein M0R40_11645 [Firmicutes bacterium]|nr:hypothetical protein [Bacillota bacterium]
MFKDTRYFEKYAMLSLDCMGLSSAAFLMGESPDLQSEGTGTGIEVTRAISERARLREFVMHELRRSYPTMATDISFSDGIAFIQAVNGLFGGKIHIEEIERSIEVKTAKLNKNYKVFAKNHLYVFTFDKNLTADYALFAVRKARPEGKVRFDLFFVNCVDKIYVTDGRKVDTVKLAPAAQKAIDKAIRENSKQNTDDR